MALLLKATLFAVLALNLVELGSALTCKKEGFLGISTFITCPQPGQPESHVFCCGEEENRYCCPSVFGDIDQETVDKIVDKTKPALAYMYDSDAGLLDHYDWLSEDLGPNALPLKPKLKRRKSFLGFSLFPVAHIRRPRQAAPATNISSSINNSTNTNQPQAANEAPIAPNKVDENEGIISDAAKKAKDKIKEKVKTKAKDKIQTVVEKETQKNLPRIIGILFGVVVVLVLVCVVCCCCCPFCILAKRRNRGHIVRGGAEVTVTVPQAATQPLQPQGPPQAYMQPQGYPPQPYPAQPYPNQPYPPQPGYPGQQPYPVGAPGPMPTPGYPVGYNPYGGASMPAPVQYDQPPPYQEKQPAFNPNYAN